ncbi:DNA-J related domain-containing protein [Alkalimonas collagenimarina]|uniref:DNA-J related domain-containing protein n=1 Tax=Alkalimonas collagenimarina TaxID=400390 RepID=A0ABT9GUW6_9GAMM|nr:DNA-J related domain-containing protein [Alkalimonas collagenimarina]MDP4534847.1 DNA-J related domain-containing protein [Alkalimonas collagenimarina]
MQCPLPEPQLRLLRGQLEAIVLQSNEVQTEQSLLQKLGLHLTSAPSDPQLALFQRHFIVQHLLYQLQLQWAEQQFAWLEIGLAKVQLHTYQAQQPTEYDQGRAGYYLDWQHFYQMSSATLEQQLDDFWRYVQRPAEADPLSLQQACQVLQLSWPCSLLQLKRQYRSLALQYHPDRGGDGEQFLQVRQAYQRLRTEFR